MEIVDNTTRSTNDTLIDNQSVCPAHENLSTVRLAQENPSKSGVCLLPEKSSLRCSINTKKDTKTAKELFKLKEMITELLNTSRLYFENNETKKFEKIISIANQSVNESSRQISKFMEEIRRKLNTFQQNVTCERKQLLGAISDLFRQCQNESEKEILKLKAYIEQLVESSRKSFVEDMGKIGKFTNNISNIINQSHIDLSGRIQNLWADIQTSFKTMQYQFVDKTTELRVHVSSEVQTFRCMYENSF